MSFKLFILAFRSIHKHLGRFLLLMFQIIISSVVFVGMLGEIQMISSTADVANMFLDSNAYYFSPYTFYDSNDIDINKLAKNTFNDKVQIGTAYDVTLCDSLGNLYNCYGYNDELLKFISFDIQDGIQFKNCKDDKYMPIIAVGSKHKVGKTVEFIDDNDNTLIKGKIIGIISDDTSLINFDSGASTDFSSIYNILSSANNVDYIIPVNSKRFCSLDTERYFDYSIKHLSQLLIFDDDVEKDSVYNFVSEYGSVTNINTMKKNYTDSINNDLVTNGIILLVFTFLTLSGIGGINGIQSIENNKTYNIYYILGLSRKECVFIEIIRTAILLLTSFLALLLIYYFTPLNQSFNPEVYKINWVTFLLTYIYITIIMIVTSCGFIYKLSKKNLISCYKKDS